MFKLNARGVIYSDHYVEIEDFFKVIIINNHFKLSFPLTQSLIYEYVKVFTEYGVRNKTAINCCADLRIQSHVKKKRL